MGCVPVIDTPEFNRYYARLLLSQARVRYGTEFSEILLRGAMRARVKSHRKPAQGELF